MREKERDTLDRQCAQHGEERRRKRAHERKTDRRALRANGKAKRKAEKYRRETVCVFGTGTVSARGEPRAEERQCNGKGPENRKRAQTVSAATRVCWRDTTCPRESTSRGQHIGERKRGANKRS